MANKKIRKAVIAAAGFGTRFLPQTKAMPKEMLPIVDKPIIQIVVEELVEAGVEDIIIVTGYSKRTIEDHFDSPSSDLVANLKKGGDSKAALLQEVRGIAEMANFVYVRQKGPLGNATPLLSAEHIIGDEPFLYAWADDFVLATPSRFRQLLAVHEEFGGSVLTCIHAEQPVDFQRYGYVGGQTVRDGLIRMDKIIEKPGSAELAPSSLASVGGYIFEPTIFDFLHQQLENLDPENEFTFQISLQRMIEDGHTVHGLNIKDGKFYDAGNKLEYLKTVVDFALMRDDIKDDFAAYLRTLDL